jgi:hypothetical protein
VHCQSVSASKELRLIYQAVKFMARFGIPP